MDNKETGKQIVDKDGKPLFKIPVDGSLGLLALGAVGITEWRKVRDAHLNSKED